MGNTASFSPRSQVRINRSSDEGENLLEEMIGNAQQTKSDDSDEDQEE
jgi:hypothetical protein